MGNFFASRSVEKLPLEKELFTDDSPNDRKLDIRSSGVSGEVVVIPVDNSKESEGAFEWYANSIHKRDNFVYVIHCEEVEHPSGKHYPDYALPREYNADPVIAEAWNEKIRKAKENGLGIVDKYQQRLNDTGMPGAVQSQMGRPGPLIVKMANEKGATMVVMGTRGMGIIRRTLLGSVSSYVVRHTDLPVTVVPKSKPSIFF